MKSDSAHTNTNANRQAAGGEFDCKTRSSVLDSVLDSALHSALHSGSHSAWDSASGSVLQPVFQFVFQRRTENTESVSQDTRRTEQVHQSSLTDGLMINQIQFAAHKFARQRNHRFSRVSTGDLSL